MFRQPKTEERKDKSIFSAQRHVHTFPSVHWYTFVSFFHLLNVIEANGERYESTRVCIFFFFLIKLKQSSMRTNAYMLRACACVCIYTGVYLYMYVFMMCIWTDHRANGRKPKD